MHSIEKATTILFGALVLAGVLACSRFRNDDASPPAPAVPTVPVPGVPAPPVPVPAPGTLPTLAPGIPGAQVVQPGAALESNFGTVQLSAGFMPDPKVAQGRSGGARDASTLSPGCTGWIDLAKPDHIFVAQTPFGANFRILAHSTSQPQQDITLVLQRPDGTFMCNDDAAQGATDPILAGSSLLPGVYRIWVGSYEQGQYADYRIAFTELASVTTESLQTTMPN
jgi:hypothetical protein